MKRLLLMSLVGTGAAGTAYAVTQLDEPEILHDDLTELGAPVASLKDDTIIYSSNNVTFEVTDADKFCVASENNSENCTWNEIEYDEGTNNEITIILDNGDNYVYFQDENETISEAIQVEVDTVLAEVTVNPNSFGTECTLGAAIPYTYYFSIVDNDNTIEITDDMLTWLNVDKPTEAGIYTLVLTYTDSRGNTIISSIDFTFTPQTVG